MGKPRQAAPIQTYQTVAEVADRFLVSPATVRRWVHAGLVEAVVSPNGRIIRFTPDAVDRFAEGWTHVPRRGRRATG